MSSIPSLYNDVVLDHIKNARNYRVMEAPDRSAEGVNALCGDTMSVYVRLDGDVIRDASFQCSCCGISMASASVMTEAVIGRTVSGARSKPTAGPSRGSSRFAITTDTAGTISTP